MSTSQLDIACTKENTEYLLAGWSSGLTFKTMCLSIILQVVRGSWGKTFSILPFFPENAIGEGLLTSRLSVNKLGQTHIALYAGNKGGLRTVTNPFKKYLWITLALDSSWWQDAKAVYVANHLPLYKNVVNAIAPIFVEWPWWHSSHCIIAHWPLLPPLYPFHSFSLSLNFCYFLPPNTFLYALLFVLSYSSITHLLYRI